MAARTKGCRCALRLQGRAAGSTSCVMADLQLYSGAYKRDVFDAADVRDIALTVIPAQDLDRVEHVVFILVDHKHRVLGVASGSAGAHDRCGIRVADIARVFEPVVERAVGGGRKIGGLFMIHNHPSGNALFSAHDVRITHTLADAHRELPWGLVDSMVLVRGGAYTSLRDFQDHARKVVQTEIGFRENFT